VWGSRDAELYDEDTCDEAMDTYEFEFIEGEEDG